VETKVDLKDPNESPRKRSGLDSITVFLFLVVFIFIGGFIQVSQALEKKITQQKVEMRELDEKIRDFENKMPHG
jgi:hypothetical protein